MIHKTLDRSIPKAIGTPDGDPGFEERVNAYPQSQSKTFLMNMLSLDSLFKIDIYEAISFDNGYMMGTVAISLFIGESKPYRIRKDFSDGGITSLEGNERNISLCVEKCYEELLFQYLYILHYSFAHKTDFKSPDLISCKAWLRNVVGLYL